MLTLPVTRTARRHSSKFLAQQQKALLTARRELATALGGLTVDTPRIDKTAGQDSGDLASMDAEADFQLSLSERSQSTLREVDLALQRIDKGIYGVCEVTGELIPEVRLRALPFARCTVTAQRQAERNRWTRRSYGATFEDSPDPAATGEPV